MIGPFTRIVLHSVGGIVGIVALVLGLGAWRLSQGPVSLAFLAPHLEAALVAGDSDSRLSFDDLVLAWGGDGRAIGIRAVDVRAARLDDAVTMRAPEMTIALSVPALARGVVAPRHIDLVAPTVHIPIRPDEAPAVGSAEETGAGGDVGFSGTSSRVLRSIAANFRTGGHLRGLNVSDATFVLHSEDPNRGWIWSFESLALEQRPGRMFAKAALSVTHDGETVAFDASASWNTDDSAGAVEATVSDLIPARLARLAPELAFAADFDLPISGNVVATRASDGHIDTVSFDLAGGAGTIEAPRPWAPGTRFAVAGVTAVGRLGDRLQKLALDDLSLDFGDSALTVNGTVGGDWDRPDAALQVVARAVPIDALDDWWPHEVLPDARRWVVANVSGGTIEEFVLRLDVPGDEWGMVNLPADRVDGRLSIDGATVLYHDALPPAWGVRAVGRFDSLGLNMEIGGGQSGPLTIRGGAIEMRGSPNAPGMARILMSVAGGSGETLAVLDQPPFRFVQSLTLDPARVSGSVAGDLTIRFPLVDAVEFDQVDISVVADLSDIAIAPGASGEPLAGRLVHDGSGKLVFEKGGIDLVVEARIDGVPGTVRWRETFFPAPGETERRIDGSAVLDAAARDRFGFGLEWLAGPVAVDWKAAGTGDGPMAVEMEIDATETEIDLPALAWSKPAGAPAAARVVLSVGSDGIDSVRLFDAAADGFTAVGSAARSDDVWAVRFDRFSSGGTDVSGTLSAGGDDPVTVAVGGRSLDLRSGGLFAESDGVGEIPPFVLSASVDRMMLDDGLVVTDATALVTFDGQVVESATVDGLLESGAPMAVRLGEGPAAGRRTLTVAADDAGHLFRALDLTPNMVGGRLTMNAEIDDRAAALPMRGVLLVNDFRMVDAPVLAQLLNLVTITGLLEQLSGDGIAFHTFRAPYLYEGGVLTLDQARASGLSLGLTMDGTIDFHSDAVDVDGMVVPLYALNSLVGAVPLIGDLLTGGDGKGVFAAPYRVQGTRAAPSVSVNPVAMLMPGVLRELLVESGRADGG